MPEPNSIWIDGPLHPDLFDNETPIRIKRTLPDGIKVFNVECTYYVPETEEHIVIAMDETEATEKAWDLVLTTELEEGETRVTEMDLHESLKIPRLGLTEMITEYLREHE